MPVISLDSWIIFTLDAIRVGFTFFTLFCLLTRGLAKDKVYREAVNIQSAANFALAFGVVFSTYIWMSIGYELNNTVSDWDNDEVVYTSNQLSYETWSLVLAILLALTGISFFFRRPRRSWVLSLLALLLLNVDYIIDSLNLQGSDYEQWEMTGKPVSELLWGLLLFAGFSFLLYWWQAKRKKLPYDSAWIS